MLLSLIIRLLQVMSGGMFAAHTESGGELVEIDGKFFKQFYGMSSSVSSMAA